jgi:hypothetical protein
MLFLIRRIAVRILCSLVPIAGLAVMPAAAFAQTSGDPTPQPPAAPSGVSQPQPSALVPPPERRPWGQVRFGSMWFTPSVSLKEFGIDTNVFNSNVADDPKSDLYAIAGPDLTLEMKTKRVDLNGAVGVNYVHYVKTFSERSFEFNGSIDGVFRPLRRLEIQAGARQGSSRKQFSPEVEVRTRNWSRAFSFSTGILVAPRLWIIGRASTSERRFDPGAIYNGVELQRTLNEDVRSSGGELRYAITPWTRVAAGGVANANRFPLAPGRDADEERYFVRLEMSARALVSGSAELGHSNYRTRLTFAPDFEGPVGNATLATRFGENTTLQALFIRDLGVSYMPSVPFMLNRELGLIGQRALTSRLSLALEAHGYRYFYKGFVATRPGDVPPPDENLERYLGRIIVRAGGQFRLGFTAEYAKRFTETELRQYEGLRFWTSIQYGRFSVRDRNAVMP